MGMRTSAVGLTGITCLFLGAACSSTPDLAARDRSPLDGAGAPVARSARSGSRDRQTRTPIRHVLVIVGENRSFDHVFATYRPRHGQRIDNLLSKGIVNED